MTKLNYTELKAQTYLTLENIKAEEVRNLFRFRVRTGHSEEISKVTGSM